MDVLNAYDFRVGRASGRTHRMVEWFVEARLSGERCVMAVPDSSVMEHVRRITDSLGYACSSKDFYVVRTGGEVLRGWRGRVFIDHTVWECLAPRQADRFMAEVIMCLP